MKAMIVADWGFRSWLLLGLILALFRVTFRQPVLSGVAFAALATGLITWLTVLGSPAQIIVFVVLTAIGIDVARRVTARRRSGKKDPLRLDDRALRLKGHIYPLSEPIVNGVGRIRIDDLTWGVSGPDLPAATLMRVTGHDGTLLTATPAYPS